jgi:hypothetical protein
MENIIDIFSLYNLLQQQFKSMKKFIDENKIICFELDFLKCFHFQINDIIIFIHYISLTFSNFLIKNIFLDFYLFILTLSQFQIIWIYFLNICF